MLRRLGIGFILRFRWRGVLGCRLIRLKKVPGQYWKPEPEPTTSLQHASHLRFGFVVCLRLRMILMWCRLRMVLLRLWLGMILRCLWSRRSFWLGRMFSRLGIGFILRLRRRKVLGCRLTRLKKVPGQCWKPEPYPTTSLQHASHLRFGFVVGLRLRTILMWRRLGMVLIRLWLRMILRYLWSSRSFWFGRMLRRLGIGFILRFRWRGVLGCRFWDVFFKLRGQYLPTRASLFRI
jgi:hypothetical protein